MDSDFIPNSPMILIPRRIQVKSAKNIDCWVLSSAVNNGHHKYGYMGINSSIQQVSGGIASFVAGLIIFQPAKNAPLQHFDTVGYVAACSMLITLGMMFIINRQVSRKLHVVTV